MKKKILNYMKSELLRMKEKKEERKQKEKEEVIFLLERDWSEEDLNSYNINYINKMSSSYYSYTCEPSFYYSFYSYGNIFKTVYDAKRNYLFLNSSLFSDEEFNYYLEQLERKKLIK